MNDAVLVAKLVAKRNIQLLKTLAIISGLGLILCMCLTFVSETAGGFCGVVALLAPFFIGFCICYGLDHRYFETHFLSRNIKRGSYICGCWIACCLPLVVLWVGALIVAIPELVDAGGIAVPLPAVGCKIGLLTLDYLLFMSLVFGSRLAGLRMASMIIGLLPLLLSFTSSTVLPFFPLNYAAPHALLMGRYDWEETLKHLGGAEHLVANAAASIVIFGASTVYYFSKDLG